MTVRDLPVVILSSEVSLETALKALRRRCDTAGLAGELRRRQEARSPGERRREKAARARHRAQQRAQRAAAEGS